MREDWRMWLMAVGATKVDPTRGPGFEHSNLVYQAAVFGEGVALGLIAISKIAVKVGVLCQIEFQHIIRLVKKFGLRTNVSSHLFACDRHQLIEKCIESTFKDKKRTPQDLRLILPTSSVGPCKVYSTNSRELIQLGIECVLENTE